MIFFMSLVIITLLSALWNAKRELHFAKEREAKNFEHYRQLVGSTRLWNGSNGDMISYNLRSFDSGQTWVAVEIDKESKMRIKGDAEKLYPGLVQQIQGMNALTEEVLKGRQIDLSNQSNQQLLTKVGFDIVNH